MTLKDVLAGLVAGSLTGPLVYWFLNLEVINERWSAAAKRYFALFAPPALAAVAFVASVLVGYVDRPGDPFAWLEALVFVLANIIVSQTIHGARTL